MTTYDKFDAAFRGVSAYAIFKHGKRAGRAVFKHGVRCTVYFQAWGSPMVTASAGGGGYDRATAAVESAAAQIVCDDDSFWPMVQEIKDAIANGPEGYRWTSRLEVAGFLVQPVIG